VKELDRVTRATETVEAARAEWEAALRAARLAGLPYSQIAQAAGVTRQRVFQLTKPR